MTEQQRYTEAIICGHCGNKGIMRIVANYSQDTTDHAEEWVYDSSTNYDIAECPACRGIVLTRWYWHEMMDPDSGDTMSADVLYPSERAQPLGLPDKVARAYRAAARVRPVDANAYGVLLGRVLDEVCVDRGATGKGLYARLECLASKGEIPEKLLKIAHGLRDLRNVGAHPTLGELTESEIPILDKLCAAIVEYVYSAPHLASLAQERWEALKNRHPKGKS